jgi:hypothetical protein
VPDLTDHLAAILQDIPIIRDDLQWAHAAAHGRPTGAIRPRRLSDTPHDPENIPGPRWDTGDGDYASRRAYQTAMTRLNTAETALHTAVSAVEPRRTQPRLTGLHEHSSLPAALGALECIEARAQWLARHHTPPAERHVRTARGEIDKTVRGLWQALGRGETGGHAHAEEPCRICQIRPRAERVLKSGDKGPSKGGRCDTCYQWHVRNPNGKERPTKIDDESVSAEPRRAAARRRARGEGWGAA